MSIAGTSSGHLASQALASFPSTCFMSLSSLSNDETLRTNTTSNLADISVCHHIARAKLEVTLTKKTPADWPELECKPGSVVSTKSEERQAIPPVKAAVESKPVVEPPSKLARPYSSTKDWDEVSNVQLSTFLFN